MHIICLDLEGVLVPEIWIAFSRATGIKELSLTTRDVADYDVLMKNRIHILKENALKLKDIQAVISGIDPLDRALDFLNRLRKMTQVIILSDTFQEFARPLMEKLEYPTLFCNNLVIDGKGMVMDYRLRQRDGKYHSVRALRGLGFKVFAVGDSYNDLSMIKAADRGALFKAPETIKRENPDLPAVEDYESLLGVIDNFLASG